MKFETEAEKIMYETLIDIANTYPMQEYNEHYGSSFDCVVCSSMINEAKEALNKIKELKEESKNG